MVDGFSKKDADDFIGCAEKRIFPVSLVQTLDMLDESKKAEGKYVRTKLKALDEALGGGIHKGSITEIVGESTIGKTTICQTIAADFAIGRCLDVVYIDTENNMQGPKRVREICRCRVENNRRDAVEETQSLQTAINLSTTVDWVKEEVNKVMKRISFRFITASVDLKKFLEEEIVEMLDDGEVGMVILDSMAHTIRRDFKDYISRSKFLGDCAILLKKIAEEYRIPVLVTNHLQAGKSSSSIFSGPRMNSNKAALGNTWHHCVSTRLLMKSEKTMINMMMRQNSSEDNVSRVIVIDKSPMMKESTIRYKIREEGIVCQEVVENRIRSQYEPDEKKRKKNEEDHRLVYPSPKTRNVRNLSDYAMN